MPLAQNSIPPNTAHLRQILMSLPPKVGDVAVAFSKQRFREKAWIGNSTEAWKARKGSSKWGKTPRNKGRALLVDTGRLRRSIRILRTTSNSVTIGTDVPYAAAHNFGFRGKVSQQVNAHSRRKFGTTKVGTGKYNKNGTERMRSKKTITGTTPVQAHARTINQNIPHRQFMGNSPYLDRQVKRLISSQIAKAFT